MPSPFADRPRTKASPFADRKPSSPFADRQRTVAPVEELSFLGKVGKTAALGVEDARRTLKEATSGSGEFSTGVASVFLPPEQDTTGGAILKPGGVVGKLANIPAALPVVGRVSRRIVEPSPIVDPPKKGGKIAENIGRSLVNSAPDIARTVGENIGAQAILEKVGVPRPVAGFLAGAGVSMADTGVPMDWDTRGKQQTLQAAFAGATNAAIPAIGSLARESGMGVTKQIAAQAALDVPAAVANVPVSGLDLNAILDSQHPEHEAALTALAEGTVPAILGAVETRRTGKRIKAGEAANAAESQRVTAEIRRAAMVEAERARIQGLLDAEQQSRLSRESLDRGQIETMELPDMIAAEQNQQANDVLMRRILNRPEPELAMPEPADFDVNPLPIDPNFEDIGGVPYREPEFLLATNEVEFQRQLLEAQQQLPARIRQGIVLPEIRENLLPRKGTNAPTPEATPNATAAGSAKVGGGNLDLNNREVSLAWRDEVLRNLGDEAELTRLFSMLPPADQAANSKFGYAVAQSLNGEATGSTLPSRIPVPGYRSFEKWRQRIIFPDLPESALPVAKKAGGGVSPFANRRRNRGSMLNIPAEVMAMTGATLIAGHLVNKWAGGAFGRAYDTALLKAKRKVTGSKSTVAEAARMFMADHGAGTEFGRVSRMLKGDEEASNAFRTLLDQDPVLRGVEGASDLQLDVMHEAVTSDSIPPQKLAILAPKQRAAVDFMKNAVEGAQTEAVARGIGSDRFREIINDSLGDFLRRGYAMNANPSVWKRNRKQYPAAWRSAVEEVALRTRKDIEEARLARDPNAPPINNPLHPMEIKQAESDLVAWMHKLQGEMKGRSTPAYGAGFKIPQGPFKARTMDDMPATRKIMGEYKHPLDAFSKTIADMHTVMNRDLFFKRLAGMKDENGVPFASIRANEETGHVVQVPFEEGRTMQPYGQMSGLYVSPSVYEAMNDSLGMSGIAGLEKVLNTMSKPMFVNQTALSTGTTGANILSNALFGSELSNTSLTNPKNYPFYGQAIDLIKNARNATPSGRKWKLTNGMDVPVPNFKELADGGAFAGTLLHDPTMTEAWRSLPKMLAEGRSFADWLGQFVSKYDKTPGIKQAVQFYRSVDHVFRAAAVLKKMKQNLDAGMSRQDALKDAGNHADLFMQNYDKIPPIAKGFQKSLLASPFQSYPIDMLRVMANGARHNPVKMGLLFGLMAAMKAGYNGVNTDEEREGMEIANPLFTDFEQPDVNAWVISNGKLTYLPTARVLPTASLMSMIQNPQFKQFFMGNPYVTFLATMGGMEPPRGAERPSREASTMERLGVAGRNLGKAMVPPLLGGWEFDRLRNAYYGEPDKYGRVQDPVYATMGTTGLRPRSMEWDSRFKIRARSLAGDTGDRIFQAMTLVDAPHPSSVDIVKEIEKLKAVQAHVEERAEALRNALAAGEKIAPKSVSEKYGSNVKDANDALQNARTQIRNAVNKAERRLQDVMTEHPEATTPTMQPVKNVGLSAEQARAFISSP